MPTILGWAAGFVLAALLFYALGLSYKSVRTKSEKYTVMGVGLAFIGVVLLGMISQGESTSPALQEFAGPLMYIPAVLFLVYTFADLISLGRLNGWLRSRHESRDKVL